MGNLCIEGTNILPCVRAVSVGDSWFRAAVRNRFYGSLGPWLNKKFRAALKHMG